jgi:hypothetical protein
MINHDIVNILSAITLLTVALGGLVHRIKTGKGIGIRFIQFLAIGMGVPLFVILALADKLEIQTIGSLLGMLLVLAIGKTGKDEV